MADLEGKVASIAKSVESLQKASKESQRMLQFLLGKAQDEMLKKGRRFCFGESSHIGEEHASNEEGEVSFKS